VALAVPHRAADQLTAAIAAARQAARELQRRPVDEILGVLDRVVATWQRPEAPWRRWAERELPAVAGFSAAMIRHGLPRLLAPWRAAAIRALLDAELGDRRRLDDVVDGCRVVGPSVVTHVLSGNLPGLAAPPILLSLAIKSACVVKPAAGEPAFADAFVASLGDVDDGLRRCVVVAHWRGGDRRSEDVAFGASRVVVASGSDAAIAALAASVPGRFIGHGHKISFAVVARECLGDPASAQRVARRLAYDVSLWDQQGCLSPQLCYVESGARISPHGFAEMLAEALAYWATALPPRSLDFEDKTALLRARQTAEWQEGVFLLASPESTAWTVTVEPDAAFVPSCLNRFVRVKVVDDVMQIGPLLSGHRRHLEAAGVAIGADRRAALTTMLAASGVHRACAIGRMQDPPVSWRQSGRPRVAEWVEWIGVEEDEGDEPAV